jgi:molybdopterin converting factor small subunit
MKVILRGTLAEGAPQQEFELPLEGGTTREDLLAGLAGRVPALARYLKASAETGKPVSLMIVADGNWVHPGDPVGANAEVEICPPISGG